MVAFEGMQSLLEILDPDSIEKPKEKNPHAQALASLGASKGGEARAAKLSPKKRSAIAKKAAQKRWSKKSKKD